MTVVIKRDGQEVGRTTTDKNGFYTFDGLESGDYTIEVVGPNGGKLAFEDRSSTVVAGEEDTGNDWGYQRPAPATPLQSVRQTLATTGAETPALLALAGFLAVLAGFATVARRKLTS